MTDFDFQPRTRVVFGAGALGRLGKLARELSFTRTLLIADRGMVETGYAAQATRVLQAEGIGVTAYHDFGANPDTAMVESAQKATAGFQSIVALGGGSSMDLAKAVNIVCHNPGKIQDYHGYGKFAGPLAPMIAVPTTAGTGSEAQSNAIISNASTHVKMAIGGPEAAFSIALLDPELTLSQPTKITATAGYDALSHAVESYVCTRRNPISTSFAREAWRLLYPAFEAVLAKPQNLEARSAMLLGAHLAGVAIENSMLGAAHACANPLTAVFGIAHGAAIALALPCVVQWNADPLYRELHSGLASHLQSLAQSADLPARLSDCNIPREALPKLAAAAAEQWTGRFNPRPFDAAAALEIYECAY